MASITKRCDSYLIRVSLGYDINGKKEYRSMTWKPSEGMTKKQIEKDIKTCKSYFQKKDEAL